MNIRSQSLGAQSRLVPRVWPVAAAAALLVLGQTCGTVQAQNQGKPEAAVAAAPAGTPAKPTPNKDVVLDRPAAASTSPAPATNSAAPAAPASGADESVRSTQSVVAQRSTVMAGNMAELGLALLRAQAAGGTKASNQVVSPVSLASALGLVHAGAAGETADQISALIAPATARGTAMQRELPNLLKAVLDGSAELASANRIWLDASLAKALPTTYVAAVTQRYQADGMLLKFAKPEEARQTINAWAAQHTGKRITSLLPAGAITPNAKVVLTNAMHFRSPWATAFEAAATTEKPFYADAKAPVKVPTMVKRLKLRMGTVDNATVYDIPFEGGRFSLTVAMPPKGHSLNAFENDLAGQDVAQWGAKLPQAECQLELPKFKIEPSSTPLKSVLQTLGVRTAFTEAADFTPLVGNASKGLALDNVYQSAGIAVDESGAEAVAATAAVLGVKSFQSPAPTCAVDRPFLFTITHMATGTPVFMGRVVNP